MFSLGSFHSLFMGPPPASAVSGTETTMRMMLKFTLPVEKSNAAINDGSLGRTMEYRTRTLNRKY